MSGGGSINNLAIQIMLSGILLGIIEKLIPNGKTEKAVSFAVSLVLLVMLLSPLKDMLNVATSDNFDVNNILESVDLQSSKTKGMRDEVENAIDEGDKMFSGIVSEYSENSIVGATVQAMNETGVAVDSDEVVVETDIAQDLITIKIETAGFDENELMLIEENTADLEVQIGTAVARKLNIERELIRVYFD